jgi:hypothetical protein
VKSEISKKADLIERNAKKAVQEAIDEMKAKGVPIIRYDPVKKQPYMEFLNKRKQCDSGE